MKSVDGIMNGMMAMDIRTEFPGKRFRPEIPISAQIVSLADVYVALTSDRVYQTKVSHERAVEMIRNRECGVFNPLLLECFVDIEKKIKESLTF